MRTFNLWVKMDLGWEHVSSVDADNQLDALCLTVLQLRPQHKGREVQLRTDAHSPENAMTAGSRPWLPSVAHA
jgi:hypothetical protein